jgi:hypothetical protein
MPHGEHEPFSGSGTTLPAAELTERVCCAIDLDPKYVDVTVQRWETLRGKKAKLEADGRTFEEVAEERRRRPHEFQAAARRSRRRKRSSGHPDVEGLCRALADWSWELRLSQQGER